VNGNSIAISTICRTDKGLFEEMHLQEYENIDLIFYHKLSIKILVQVKKAALADFHAGG